MLPIARGSVLEGSVLLGYSERVQYSFDQADIPAMLAKAFLRSMPQAVLKPKTLQDLVMIVRYARSRRIPVTPRGAASSAFGGAVPARAGIVVDASSMHRILRVSPAEEIVEIEPGVRWAELAEAIQPFGLALRSHPSSWFSTVAGWVCTGGYGIRSLKFGHLRDQVDEIELVTGNGERRKIRCGEPGFDHIFGSEGQLGVVSRIVLRVRRRPSFSVPKAAQFPDEDDALNFIRALTACERTPAHIMYLDPLQIDHLNELNGRVLVPRRSTVLVETEEVDELRAFSEALSRFPSGKEAANYVAGHLWHERLFPLRPMKLGPGMLNSEVMLPLRMVREFTDSSRRIARTLGATVAIEAHIVRKSEALVLVSLVADRRKLARYLLNLGLVLMLEHLGVQLGGRIYGVGVWNAPLADRRFTKEKLGALKALKRKLDPEGILNPGKFLESPRRLALTLIHKILGALILRFLTSVSHHSKSVNDPILENTTRRFPSRPLTTLEEAAYGCARCGACVPVCPAYLATGDETVTGRGKLYFLTEILSKGSVSRDVAQKMFLCMHCKACQEVCQSGLRLMEAWDALESVIEARFGKPLDKIARFVEAVESSEEYQRILDRGLRERQATQALAQPVILVREPKRNV